MLSKQSHGIQKNHTLRKIGFGVAGIIGTGLLSATMVGFGSLLQVADELEVGDALTSLGHPGPLHPPLAAHRMHWRCRHPLLRPLRPPLRVPLFPQCMPVSQKKYRNSTEYIEIEEVERIRCGI